MAIPVERWNQHEDAADGIARTTNAVEGWHYGLQVLLQCHHPTLWNFLDGIARDMKKQKMDFLKGIAGINQPQRIKYRDLKDHVGRAVDLYLYGYNFSMSSVGRSKAAMTSSLGTTAKAGMHRTESRTALFVSQASFIQISFTLRNMLWQR